MALLLLNLGVRSPDGMVGGDLEERLSSIRRDAAEMVAVPHDLALCGVIPAVSGPLLPLCLVDDFVLTPVVLIENGTEGKVAAPSLCVFNSCCDGFNGF